MKRKSSVNNLCLIAISVAFICVIAPFVIPIGTVPFSFADFIILLLSSVLGKKAGSIATILYILIGGCGLPVFSGFSGGVGKLLGPTGGFIIGFIPMAYINGMGKNKKNSYLYSFLAVLCDYIIGTIYFMFVTRIELFKSLLICVVPFIIPDIIKIFFAKYLSLKLKKGFGI